MKEEVSRVKEEIQEGASYMETGGVGLEGGRDETMER